MIYADVTELALGMLAEMEYFFIIFLKVSLLIAEGLN